MFSQQTLRLETMLLDEGILTEMRTAAASCLASRTLLGPARCGKINKIGIIGVGIQALWQLRYYCFSINGYSVTFGHLGHVLKVKPLLMHVSTVQRLTS